MRRRRRRRRGRGRGKRGEVSCESGDGDSHTHYYLGAVVVDTSCCRWGFFRCFLMFFFCRYIRLPESKPESRFVSLQALEAQVLMCKSYMSVWMGWDGMGWGSWHYRPHSLCASGYQEVSIVRGRNLRRIAKGKATFNAHCRSASLSLITLHFRIDFEFRHLLSVIRLLEETVMHLYQSATCCEETTSLLPELVSGVAHRKNQR